jgi:ATP-dependent Clp protease ATP-binding subunit ClpC
MYERFTDRSRKVMQLANNAALKLNHEYVGTEHMLLGLIEEGAGVACCVLRNLDLDPAKIQKKIESIVCAGPEPVVGKLPHTPRVKKAIEYAIEEARNLVHNYVGTEHLLLGLLRVEEGVASQVMAELGIKIAEVRQEIMYLLGRNADGTPVKKAEEILAEINKVLGLDIKPEVMVEMIKNITEFSKDGEIHRLT